MLGLADFIIGLSGSGGVIALKRGLAFSNVKAQRVTRGLECHEAAWDARRWRESLEQEMTIRRSRLSDAIAGVRVDSDDMVDSMFAMLTLTDREMYEHGDGVAVLAVSVARILGLPDE